MVNSLPIAFQALSVLSHSFVTVSMKSSALMWDNQTVIYFQLLVLIVKMGSVNLFQCGQTVFFFILVKSCIFIEIWYVNLSNCFGSISMPSVTPHEANKHIVVVYLFVNINFILHHKECWLTFQFSLNKIVSYHLRKKEFNVVFLLTGYGVKTSK